MATPLNQDMTNEVSTEDVEWPRPLEIEPEGEVLDLTSLMAEPAEPVAPPQIQAPQQPEIDFSQEIDFNLFDTADGKPMRMAAKQALDIIDGDLVIYDKLLNCVNGET